MEKGIKLFIATAFTAVLFWGIGTLIAGNPHLLEWHWSGRLLMGILLVVNIANAVKQLNDE